MSPENWEEVFVQKTAAKVVGESEACVRELQVTRAALVRYRSAMAGVVRSIGVSGPTVEDVVHDAFEMACRKPELERPDPRDERGFQAWLCTLAKYAALTARNDNARSREVASPREDLEDVPEPHRPLVSRCDDKVDAAVVLAKLDEEDRSLLHEHFYEDKTIQELAAERGVPWTTMRSRLDGVIHRARTIVDDRATRRRGLVASAFLWISVSLSEVVSRISGSWSKKQRLAAAGAAGLVMGGLIVSIALDRNARFDALAISDFSQRSDSFALMNSDVSALSFTSFVTQAAVVPPVVPKVKVEESAELATTARKTATKTNSSKASAVEDEERSRAILPWAVAAALRDQAQEGKGSSARK